MDRFKDLAKRGWHPEKDSGHTGGIKEQVKGLVGKGDSRPAPHYSTPYEKKNPASFPPPPPTKRYQSGEGPVAPPPRKQQPALPPRGEGAVEDESPREARPFVADTSAIDTSKYPKPPPRNTSVTSPAASAALKPKPALPPRLPPRNGSTPTSSTEGVPNQGVLNRLGNAGISVPGFGIGAAKSPPPVPSRTAGGALSPPAQAASSVGTTWAEKQAALKTANSLRADPSKVSLSEIRSAAATAQNFQNRHGDQVADGLNSAQQANQKYGLSDRMAGLSVGTGKPRPPAPPPKKFQADPPAIPFSSKPKPS